MKMLEPYMRNNMQHLKEMTRSILSKTGEEIYDLDYDDFYSILEGNNFLQIVEDKLTELKIDTSYKNLISKHPAQDIIF